MIAGENAVASDLPEVALVANANGIRYGSDSVDLMLWMQSAAYRRTSDMALERARKDGRDVVTGADVRAVMRSALAEIAVEATRPAGRRRRPSKPAGKKLPTLAELKRRQRESSADALAAAEANANQLIGRPRL